VYRLSPLTYLISALLSTSLHARPITCAVNELSTLTPPAGQTYLEYLTPFLHTAPGDLLNPSATKYCQYCPLSTADQYLAGVDMSWDTRWRNLGIGWVYVVFSVWAAVVLYFFFLG